MIYKIKYKDDKIDNKDISNLDEFISDNILMINTIHDEDGRVLYDLNDKPYVSYQTCGFRYIKTFESFTEPIRKYYDVVFKENTTFNDVYNGSDESINVSVNKGDKVRIFINKEKTNDNNMVVNGFRPLLKSKSNESISVELKNLWNGSFILNSDKTFDKNNLPFEIK